MVEPLMQSPLHVFGLDAMATPINDSKGAWVHEIPFLGYISLRGNSSDALFMNAATSALGVVPPTEPCTFAEASDNKVLWISSDEWMVVCPRDRLTDLKQALTKALGPIHSQVADNSGGYTQVILQGRNAKDVLQHVSVYDVSTLKAGKVVGTTFGKASVYLHRQGDGYSILLRRSFADYIWRYLVRAATPYGLGIARLDERTKVNAGVAA